MPGLSEPHATSPAEHAVLSPSSSERWIACPASVGMVAQLQDVPEIVSSYALEGTAAHALGELMARFTFNMIDIDEYTVALEHWRKEYSIDGETEAEMEEHCAAYVELLEQRMAEFPDTVIMLEQRLPTGVPSSWGTSDAVLVSPRHVEIVDLKYGKGVRVTAPGNPQLKLYGVGALEAFGDLLGEVELVRVTVFQPRLEHTDSDDMDPAELRAWRDSLIPIAEEALAGSDRFSPGEETCRWCPAAGRCPAQFTYVVQRDFGSSNPALLSPEELADVLEQLPIIEAWCSAVRETTLRMAYHESTPIPGYKVVMTTGKRSISDGDGAIKMLKEMGYEEDQVTTKTVKCKGIGELTKLLGKTEFVKVMEPFITKGTGTPTLAREDDPRPDVDRNSEAVKDFS